ncbi:MAG: chaperone protein DnaJ 1 [Chloroflexota bacterium]
MWSLDWLPSPRFPSGHTNLDADGGASMAMTATDHYQTLGVERSATPAQLKAAYFKLIREFTPENNPQRYFAIAEAYRELSNPEKRAEYDKRKSVPDAVVELVAEALAALEDEDHDTAIRTLKEVTKRAPQYEDGWFFLGRACEQADRYSEAIQAFLAALDRNPKNARTLLWLGDAERKSGNQAAARRHLKEAIVLDPKNSDAYHCLAWSYVDTNEEYEALKIVDRGIHADGQIDVQDLPLFIQKFVILSRMDRWDDMKRTLRELDQAVPRGDADARKYCAQQFMQILKPAADAGRMDMVAILVEALEYFDPQLLGKHPELRRIKDDGQAAIARRKLYADDAVPGTVKALVQFWSGDAEPDDAHKFRESIPFFIGSDLETRTSEWESARARHPEAINPLQSHWNSARQMAAVVATHAAGRNAKGGCLVLFATVFTMAASIAALLAIIPAAWTELWRA